MAKDGVTQADNSSVIEKSLGLVDRAWDAQWALRLLFMMLFFDGAMLLHYERGLWQWSEVGPDLLQDVGWLACIVVAFCITAAIVMPTLLTILSLAISSLVLALPAVFWSDRKDSVRTSIGEVPASAVRDEALKQSNDFLLRLYENHERERRNAKSVRQQVGNLLAAAVLAVLADWWIGNHAVGGLSLIGVIIDALGSWSNSVLALVLIPVGLCLKWAWFPPHIPNYIYYPPLERKQKSQFPSSIR